MPTKLAVFASGTGSNFVAIADAIANDQLDAQIEVLVVDKINAPVVQRAAERNIPVFHLKYKDFATKELAEAALVTELQKYAVELIALAGFMRIITGTLLAVYPNKIINIHPSLLPAFPGRHGIDDALAAQVSQTGVTIHYVDSGIDSGTIIAQQAVTIEPTDTITTLATKIHALEHVLYPTTLAQLIKHN